MSDGSPLVSLAGERLRVVDGCGRATRDRARRCPGRRLHRAREPRADRPPRRGRGPRDLRDDRHPLRRPRAVGRPPPGPRPRAAARRRRQPDAGGARRPRSRARRRRPPAGRVRRRCAGPRRRRPEADAGTLPVLAIPEGALDERIDGLAADAVAPLRARIDALGRDRDARRALAARALAGSLAGLGPLLQRVADDAEHEAIEADALRRSAQSAFESELASLRDDLARGTFLRAEALRQWQAFVGADEVTRLFSSGIGKVRGTLSALIRGTPRAPVAEVREDALRRHRRARPVPCRRGRPAHRRRLGRRAADARRHRRRSGPVGPVAALRRASSPAASRAGSTRSPRTSRRRVAASGAWRRAPRSASTRPGSA